MVLSALNFSLYAAPTFLLVVVISKVGKIKRN